MSDEVKAQADTETTKQVQQEQGQSDTSSKELAELKALLETQKKEIAALNQAVSREKNAAEEAAEKAAREKMSEIERLQADFEKERSEREKWQREARVKENMGIAKDLLNEKKLPSKFLETIDDFSDTEAVQKKIDAWAMIADEMRSSVAGDFANKYGQKPPKTGGDLNNDIGAQIQAKKASGDIDGATRLAVANAIKQAKREE